MFNHKGSTDLYLSKIVADHKSVFGSVQPWIPNSPRAPTETNTCHGLAALGDSETSQVKNRVDRSLGQCLHDRQRLELYLRKRMLQTAAKAAVRIP